MSSSDPRVQALRAAPPLAILAALAAVVDLAINRVVVRAAAESVEAPVLLEWMRMGALPRNLAGIAGLYALVSALTTYLRMPGFAPLYVRLPVAGFAGILMPSLTIALMLPRERLTPLIVLIGMFATNALISLFGSAGASYRDRVLKVALILAVATALQALVVVTIASLRAVLGGGIGGPIAYLCRHGGELTWLLVPLVLVPAALPRGRDRRAMISWGAAALVLVIGIALAMAGQDALPPHYSTVLYGAFRVAALPEEATILYVLVATVGFAAAFAGMTSDDPWKRQLGAGMALWIAGGYAARSPIQLLDAVLGIILLARAAQAADPEGLRRAALRWRSPPTRGASAIIEREPEPEAEREPAPAEDAERASKAASEP
ncbi:hypothetical protein [Sandaracinus amylolyticus]|uniref:Uncharacterized protein n=1 Tax=Sandaracinus amylolyticus TaxID=927083 RepID=A0A0F6SHM3_9BACT|nr:hypothetical protein [Sandaracinus amylolyticus]AKF10694.1 hypothetical protein DB32_007843 [Sandaracinus amylolyticus]